MGEKPAYTGFKCELCDLPIYRGETFFEVKYTGGGTVYHHDKPKAWEPVPCAARLKQALADQSREHGAEVARLVAALQQIRLNRIADDQEVCSQKNCDCSQCIAQAALTGSDAALQEADPDALTGCADDQIPASVVDAMRWLVDTPGAMERFNSLTGDEAMALAIAAKLRAEAKGGSDPVRTHEAPAPGGVTEEI